jgi:hypothetical protein
MQSPNISRRALAAGLALAPVALLRYTAKFLEDLGINDTKVEDVLPDAIRRAADFLDGRV